MDSKPHENRITRDFLDIIDNNSLTQIVKDPTYYENTLDLFLVSNPSLVYNAKVIPGISRDGHHAVYAELDVSLTRRRKKRRQMHSYKKADWESFRTHMKTAGDDILAETNEDTPVDDILNCSIKQ